MRLVLNQIVSACLFILWTARLLRAAFYIPSTRRAEIALHATQVANLQGRGFQTGDVLALANVFIGRGRRGRDC
jgi:hypothetical protein